ncbi:MAG: CRISPR-associated helicase Cas3' [Candidatus Omnitrophica bacterium]|nr:CRISPR-associated helicase Cas3' [Candidatus Omnitrophota bacterium]
MRKQYYAHSLEGRPKEKWQLLEEHLQNVAKQAKKFASVFGAGEWGYVAGIMHDIGKYSKEFQEMLEKSANEEASDDQQRGPDHSSAGAQEAVKRLTEGIGKLFAYCIAGHHAGLLDAQANGACLNNRLSKTLKDYSAWQDEFLELSDSIKLPINFDGGSRINVGFQLQFFVRMLFSCLVDADFLDTEAFMDGKKSVLRGNSINLADLRDRVIAEVGCISNNDTLVNRMRRKVFEQCLESAKDRPGIFSLTVPTGGGKTLSSLAFALNHAIEHGMKRVIYVIPYTSIIEQNAEVFRRVCGESAVLEHHCNFEFSQDSYKVQLAAENWDAPLIVTTNVQFFETLFHYRVSKCRKAHNIANSVIIFDEAQILPVDLIKPCMATMKELVRNYHDSIVLSTATQPALNFSDEFISGLKEIKEIVENPTELYRALTRVKIEKLPSISDDEIIKRIGEYKQVLCVVNTRKHARQLYGAIPDKKGLYHLSALMCPVHRSQTIADIKVALKGGNVCRVISTQLIEAGVDIDFPVVFRALAGIDSIAQSAGRCNREGRLVEDGKVYVFVPKKSSPPGFLRQSTEVAEGVMRRYENILSLEAVRDYFRELYWRNEDSLDKNKILERFAEAAGNCDFSFRTIGEEFRWIENGMQAIIIPYNDEAKKLITALKISDSKEIARKLQRFSVQVYPDIIAKLGRAALEPVNDRYYVLINDHLYKNDIGLDWNDPYFRSIEGDIF